MSAQVDNQPLIEYGTSPTMVCDWRFSCIVEGDSVDLGEEWTGTAQEADREARRRMLAYEDETGITPDLVHMQMCSRWRVREDVGCTYTLNCQRCGGIHYSPDGFAPLCPRCQQLAELEAEIGRLQIGAMMVSSLDDIVSDVSVVNNSPHNPHLWTHLWCLIEKEQDELIARWRKLHAEGAEGGKG